MSTKVTCFRSCCGTVPTSSLVFVRRIDLLRAEEVALEYVEVMSGVIIMGDIWEIEAKGCSLKSKQQDRIVSCVYSSPQSA